MLQTYEWNPLYCRWFLSYQWIVLSRLPDAPPANFHIVSSTARRSTSNTYSLKRAAHDVLGYDLPKAHNNDNDNNDNINNNNNDNNDNNSSSNGDNNTYRLLVRPSFLFRGPRFLSSALVVFDVFASTSPARPVLRAAWQSRTMPWRCFPLRGFGISFGDHPLNFGATRGRLARPLREDDMRSSRSVNDEFRNRIW